METGYYTAEKAVVNGEESISIFKWESMDVARKRLHGHLNYYIGLEGCSHVAVAILSDNMVVLRSEEWRASESEVTE